MLSSRETIIDMRKFALSLGIFYLAMGMAALVPGLVTPPPLEAPLLNVTLLYGYLFGLFPSNVSSILFYLIIGAWGISVFSNLTHSLAYARSVAIIYAAFAILGLIPGLNTLLGLAPLYGNTIWLHALTAIIAGYFSFYTREDKIFLRNRPMTTPDITRRF